MSAQNLSNTSWAFAALRMPNQPLLTAISAAAIASIAEFDMQGLANMLWSFSSLPLSPVPLISPLKVRIVMTTRECATALTRGFGRLASTAFYEAARFMNHICQIIWSLSFAGLLDQSIGYHLKCLMLSLGSQLDAAAAHQAGQRSAQVAACNLQQWRGDTTGIETEPQLLLRLPGVSVALKPPNWEVDAKGQLSKTGRYLSHFLQRHHAPEMSPVLRRPEFEYGLVHRLDVPSSGLILVGTRFQGYSLLQWQMHTYAIQREYSVLLRCTAPEPLWDISAPVQDFLPGRSFVDEAGRPAQTHLKTMFHTRHQCRLSADYFTLVCIAIHTGRRHQIRAHTQWEGYPTVTDEKYSHREVTVTS
mmetsp:Transcript_14338/g.36146  ORF Transcript_14338/g.36146 Transcript_14338/m.36146 type:complete len:361 (+) Transcript_14338:46-1128(+)